MATATIRIWEGASGSKTKNLWGSQSIANINSIIKNSLPKYYKITAATLRVYANFDGAGGLANVYMKYGFSNSTNSISRQLGGEFKLTKNDAAYSVDIIGYIGRYKEVITTYGSNFVANVYTSNVVVGSSGALHISYAELYVTYEVNPITINGVASPSEGGIVTGSGTFEMYDIFTLTATPNKGYKFIKWVESGASITTNPLTMEAIASSTYTAYFEKELINNIQIGKTKPSGIYYNATTKTITFVIADAVSITSSGADTVDGYHLVISNTVPSGATPIKGVQVGTTYVYTT